MVVSKEGSAASLSKNISNSQVCIINNNRALVITRNVVLVQNGRSRFTDVVALPLFLFHPPPPPPLPKEREAKTE